MDKIAALQEILTQAPTDSFARYGLAMAYAADGKTDQALTEYTTILTGNPDYVPAYQMSAQTLIRLGRTEEATTRLHDGIAATLRTGNTHAQSEMQAMLDDLNP